jgi:hypothetical protein
MLHLHYLNLGKLHEVGTNIILILSVKKGLEKLKICDYITEPTDDRSRWGIHAASLQRPRT